MAQLKICGLMRPEDVLLCCACGVDLIGFVVCYPKPVPWNLDIRGHKTCYRTVRAKAAASLLPAAHRNKFSAVQKCCIQTSCSSITGKRPRRRIALRRNSTQWESAVSKPFPYGPTARRICPALRQLHAWPHATRKRAPTFFFWTRAVLPPRRRPAPFWTPRFTAAWRRVPVFPSFWRAD